jgi:hypothetical protein
MTLEQQIEALINRFTPRIRDAFLTAIQDVTNRTILADMVRAIQIGDVEQAFRALGFSPAAMRPITAMIEQAFEAGGVLVGGTFPARLNTPTGRTVFRFDIRDSRAEAWLRDYSSTLITRITDDTRVVVRNVLTDAMNAGRNPRNTALDIVGRVDQQSGRRVGGVVGLTPQFERAVARAREELRNLDSNYFTRERRDRRFDATVHKAIRDGKPLDAETINRLTGRYSDSLLQLRGETIARTESIAALNRSEWEALMQAKDMGAINDDATVRIWDATGDRRTRHTHMVMHGQKVGLDEPFKLPGGKTLMYPGDTSLGAPASETINCRCRVRLKVDWLAATLGPDDPPRRKLPTAVRT